MAQVAEWIAQVVGMFEADAHEHKAHAACMTKLRKEGVIR